MKKVEKRLNELEKKYKEIESKLNNIKFSDSDEECTIKNKETHRLQKVLLRDLVKHSKGVNDIVG